MYGLKVNRPLIRESKIEIRTDHRPLVWLLTFCNPSGRIARWQVAITEYELSIKHLLRKANIAADALSRLRSNREQEAEFILAIARARMTDGASLDGVVTWDLR